MTESANDSKQTNELKDPYQSLLSGFPEEFLEFARKADLTPPPEMPDEFKSDHIRMLKFFRGELVIKKEDILQIKLQNNMREEAKKKINSQKERKDFLYSILRDNQIKQSVKDNKLKMAQRQAMVLLKNWK